jgi:hypothetical protein
MYNIFFHEISPAERDSIRVGAGWTGVELAEVSQGDGLATIYAARFRAAGTAGVQYVVDTDGDRDLAEERPLSFQRRNAVEVATVPIEVHSLGGTRRRVLYQVLLAEQYSYARIAEYLDGTARISGRDYALRLRSASANDPFYALNSGTRLLIDLNADGRVAEQPLADAQGVPSSAEEVQTDNPFVLAGRPYEAASLDSLGMRLALRPSVARVAPVAGFEAPELQARLLSGSSYQLSSDRGRIVLVEFWSVDCRWSESARPALNALAATIPADRFRWVAMAKESDSAVVQSHLADHSMSATVALSDSIAWARYDPAIATPLFYVIDETGVVRLRAVGASAVSSVAAMVKQMLDSVPQTRTH